MRPRSVTFHLSYHRFLLPLISLTRLPNLKKISTLTQFLKALEEILSQTLLLTKMSIPIIKDKLDPRFSRNISSELFRISMSRIFVVSIRPINWKKVCWCRRSNINLIVSNKSCKQAILVLYQIIKCVRINLRTHSLSAQRWINLLSQSQHQLTLLMHRQQSLQCLFQPHQ